MMGGLATCTYELSKALSLSENVSVKLLAASAPGDTKFDETAFCPTQRLPLSRRSELAALQMVKPLRSEIQEWKPDAVLNFLWLPEGVSTYFSTRGTSVPYFIIAHGVEVMESSSTVRKRLRQILSPLKRRVFKNAGKIFTVSHYTQRLVVENCGISRDLIQVIFNAVDSEKFIPGPKPAKIIQRHGLEGKKVFLTITRLVDYKGVDFALRALKKILPEFPDAVYLICGEGEDRSRLESLSTELGLSKNVVFTGKLAPDELIDYYNASDAFILLSRDDLITPNVEGFGIVFLEAAACGKPSIAGNSGGIPDAVIDGETGWLVDPCDVERIAGAMRNCLADPQMTERLGNQAMRRVREKLTWKNVASIVLKEIRESDHVRN